MKIRSILGASLLVILSACQTDKLNGEWKMVDVKLVDGILGIGPVVEINTVYHFHSGGQFSIDGGLLAIKGIYTRKNDTITIEKIFEGRRNRIEKHEILELTRDKLVLEDLENGDVRVLRRN